MTPEIEQQVKDYVYAKYKNLEKKNLIVKDKVTHFQVLLHKDGSPMILGKDILNK